MLRLRAGALALVLAVAAATAATPARAQEGGSAPDPSSTTATSAPAPTTEATSPPPAVVPGAPEPAAPPDPNATTSTTLPPPEDDPAAHGDAPPETVPPVSVTVPPREQIQTGGAYAGQGSFDSYPGRVVRVSSRTARARAAETQAALDAATARRDLLGLRRDELRAEIAALAVEERAAIEALEAAQLQLEARAAEAYMRGSLGGARALILSDTATAYAQRVELLQIVAEADERAVEAFREARAAVDDEQVRAATELANTTREHLAAEEAVRAAQLERDLANRELAVYLAGGTLVIHGFVFPVAQPHQFGDSFGAPRMVGTEYEHWHEGTDIMAPMGTLLLACERGVVMRIGRGGVLGGNTVWLRGESGTAYYYAHLSEFAPGLREGLVVDAGTVLGLVGDTGNARGGAPHVHFEVHPGGGAAVNPYPILAVTDGQPQPEPIWIEQPQ